MVNKTYYKKIFDSLIPKTKNNYSIKFSEAVNINIFFDDLKVIEPKSFNILINKNCKSKEVEFLIGEYLIEAFFLSKKVKRKLNLYENKKFKIYNNKKNERYIFNLLK